MFGKRLRELREINNITQEELGKIINMSKANISKLEAGTIEASFDVLNLIADYFDVSIDWLLGKSDIRNPYRKNSHETIAAHRTDGYDLDLPEEAQEELRNYIEYLKHKYKKK